MPDVHPPSVEKENINKIRLGLFFTWNVSLIEWKETGLLEREIRLYEELVKKGVEITFFTWGSQEDYEIGLKELPLIRIVPIYTRLPFLKNKILRNLIGLFTPFFIREELRHLNILKTNQLWGGWIVLLCKLFCSAPVIVRCGYEFYSFTLKEKIGFIKKQTIWFVSLLTYRLGQHVCVATEEDKNFILKTFGIRPKKISVHPNWIDTDLFKPKKNLNKSADRKTKRLLYVGRLSRQKNLRNLIKAVSETDVVLDIIGQGSLEQELRAYALEINANVNFVGVFQNNELPKIMANYSLFILPSLYEGNPKSLLEAMACGLAVIGTNVEGIRSVIQHGQTGLLCQTDPANLKQAIMTLANDSNLQKELGKNAYKMIQANQTLSHLVNKEIVLYKKMLEKKGHDSEN